ncbi:MAG: PepSY-associated TM helix domain-containing protein [Nitrospira sp.]
MSNAATHRPVTIRPMWVLLHRYAGLFMAGFLIVAALTGSILAFDNELSDWLNPPPRVTAAGRTPLSPMELRERALAIAPQAQINSVLLSPKPERASLFTLELREDSTTGEPIALPFNRLWLDPYSGAEVAHDSAPDSFWPLTRQNLIPFIVALHYKLALPGEFGVWLFGIAALLWTVDCFVGVYLTFPVRVRRSEVGEGIRPGPQHSWLARWKPAWLVQWPVRSSYRLNIDLHRAGGLWPWVLALVLAWSSVGFNLYESVYLPVMQSVFGMTDSTAALPTFPVPKPEPGLSWREAHRLAQQRMAEQAQARGFSLLGEESLQYDPARSVFYYVARTDRDLSAESGGTVLILNAVSGDMIDLSLPSGQNLGMTLHSWLFALHMATVWGVPYKVLLALAGIVIAVLCVTGLYLWWKKRRSRVVAAARRLVSTHTEAAQ